MSFALSPDRRPGTRHERAELDQRITLELPDDEIGELAATFNAMLTRLEVAFGTLQRFTADAAHELRAPLAVLTTEVEVALKRTRTADEYAATLVTVLTETEHLNLIANQLLTLARADAGVLVPTLESSMSQTSSKSSWIAGSRSRARPACTS